ncbi:MAG: pyridoxal-phosphate dependent enzyme [Caldilineaceae bacterium]
MAELSYLQRTFVGRPTPITYARLVNTWAAHRSYLKREDLAHTRHTRSTTPSGQALLMKRKMGKTRIVAETGAGQHGVATATAAALLGIECIVYMGTVDMARQQPNVFRMRLLGTEVRGVKVAHRRSKTPSTKPSATGSPMCAPPTTCWATWGRTLPRHGARLPIHHRL